MMNDKEITADELTKNLISGNLATANDNFEKLMTYKKDLHWNSVKQDYAQAAFDAPNEQLEQE